MASTDTFDVPMTEPITIYITAKDLREAVRQHGSKCLIARALHRAFLRTHAIPKGAYLDVTVIANPVVQVLQKGRRAEIYWWVTSTAAKDLIRRWDTGEVVKPTKFRLQPGKVRER